MAVMASVTKQSTRDRVLFIDDAQIQSMHGVQRRIHPGARFEGNPLLRGDRAWESGQLMLGTVLKEDGLYRMWYGSGVGSRGYGKGRLWHMYAESDDGLEWRLPSLRQFTDPEGSTENNVFLDPESGAHQYSNVMQTPEMGPGRRYTLLAYSRDGHYVRFSDDGLLWTEWSSEPVIPRFADVGFYLYDEREKLFRGMVKRYLHVRGRRRRIQHWTASADGYDWRLPLPAVIPDQTDDQWTDGDPDRASEIYGIPIFRYGPLLLGFMDILRTTDAMGTPGVNAQGIMDVQLISSRDGRTWERVGDRRRILEMGRRGEWDGGHIRSTQSFVEDGDELRLYYFAMDHAHGAPKKGDWQRAIGLATWQRDRLVGLRAGDEGEVITVPVPAGGELHINADASEGQLTAELVDRTGTVVPGFERDACLAFDGDSLDHVIRWRDHAPGDRPGQSCGVRLGLRNAEIFSLWFA
jgi:hypothetical protein